jgi:hypothetical protein
LFLLVLILTVFVLPSVGFERNHLKLYGDIAFSVVLIFGIGIAKGHTGLFVMAASVSVIAIVARWMAWRTPTDVDILFREATGLAAVFAIMVVLLWQVFRAGPVTATRIQGAIALTWLWH